MPKVAKTGARLQAYLFQQKSHAATLPVDIATLDTIQAPRITSALPAVPHQPIETSPHHGAYCVYISESAGPVELVEQGIDAFRRTYPAMPIACICTSNFNRSLLHLRDLVPFGPTPVLSWNECGLTYPPGDSAVLIFGPAKA